ncbi:MAG TPA: ABC transporter ATP-binding protein [Anaerolineales bacterium]|nr:ABC transporter ATP-binding protein [Anaerolineales bacterium]
MVEQSLLSVRNLTLEYKTRKGFVSAVDNVSFDLKAGQAMGLVGESGCGKTTIAMALLRLSPDNAIIRQGQILLDGQDLLIISEQQMRDIRWARISMVFQAAMNALDPVYRVGDQIIEALDRHQPDQPAEQKRQWVAELFKLVGIDPKMISRYPHEFSGGMRQRAVIAMALACNPSLIIADEPTTALDVIVQDQVLRELSRIQKTLNMSMIYISHDIAVIAEVADIIGIMYAGCMVEKADTRTIFKSPRHRYTKALLSTFPSITGPKAELVALPGDPPDLLLPPLGCRFHPRCPHAISRCRREKPHFEAVGDGHWAACWNPA